MLFFEHFEKGICFLCFTGFFPVAPTNKAVKERLLHLLKAGAEAFAWGCLALGSPLWLVGDFSVFFGFQRRCGLLVAVFDPFETITRAAGSSATPFGLVV